VGSDDQELRHLVRRYRVTWEARSELAASGSSVSPVGHVVELNATPEHASHPPIPGCPQCGEVADALERLAQAVVPAATAASLNEIHVRRGRIQIDPAHDSRPELSATITILRADGANSPAAEVQHRVAEVTGRLRSLGAQERQWQEGAASK
jgi:hypothetical protein